MVDFHGLLLVQVYVLLIGLLYQVSAFSLYLLYLLHFWINEHILDHKVFPQLDSMCASLKLLVALSIPIDYS